MKIDWIPYTRRENGSGSDRKGKTGYGSALFLFLKCLIIQTVEKKLKCITLIDN